MVESTLKLKNAPVVEAVLDIECDMPTSQDFAALEKPAREAFGLRYPHFQAAFVQEHRIEPKTDGQPKLSVAQRLQGFQFRSDDGKQLVQVRMQGYSFNRLAPYSTLDEYFPEMEQTWKAFAKITSPVQVRMIRLRYINRIMIPILAGKVTLEDYFKIYPRLPDEEKLMFVSFFNQHTAVEKITGNQITTILAGQPSENDRLPVIFDITSASIIAAEASNWPLILSKIQSLRALKNEVFRNTLTDKCIELFQQ